MSRVPRSVRKRKKNRKLGKVDIIRREEYEDLDLDARVELIRSLVPLGLMHVHELIDQEVKALAGERYARKEAAVRGRRHGSNPGVTVRAIGSQSCSPIGSHPCSPDREPGVFTDGEPPMFTP